MESADWNMYKHFFTRQDVPPKTLLLREGDISKTAYYIEKGCVRSWFNNDGKDITFQFFFEGQGVSSVESFINNQPSLYGLETIEPCILQGISKSDFYHILDHSTGFKKEFDRQIFNRLFFYQQLFLSRIKDSPQKRYEVLLKEHPEILKRI